MRKLLFLGLIAALAPAPTALADIIAKDGVEVAVLPTVAPGAGSATSSVVALDVEARSDAAAGRLGFRSLHAVTAIDCRSGANRFLEAKTYGEPDLAGPPQVRRVSGEWVRPAADSFMAAVLQRMCGAPPAPTSPAIKVTEIAAPPPAPAPAPAAASPAAPASAAAEAAAPTTPLPSPPSVTVMPPPAALAAAPMSPQARPPRPAGPAIAQVAASPTAKGAARVLGQLKTLLAPPLAGDVEPAIVGGAQVYRVSVSGFASAADARAFCARAQQVVKTCWVRPLTLAGRDDIVVKARPRPSAE
jgi:hypothetical protein